MKVYLNGVNITEYINESSYKVNAIQIYTEWVDGNFVTHRKPIREKVTGEFVIAMYGRNEMTTKDFIELWESAVQDGKVTINLYVENKAKNQIIEAFYDIQVDSHREIRENEYVDLISIELEEA